ncbi:MAG TPA: hypothetical protein VMT93_09640 [Gemmatimonadaceae bacterium]|nr:hypothetical protein [Gemmatimonadaceae bacterium]
MRTLRIVLAVAALAAGLARPCAAQARTNWGPACGVPDTTVHKLPFSREENADGAKFVWFSNCRAGLRYPYTPTAMVPESRYFTEIDGKGATPVQPGDIAWWPWFMAVSAGPDGPLGVVGPPLALADVLPWFGAPRWFRRVATTDSAAAVAPPTKWGFPWRPGDAPPPVAGLHLLASRAGIDSALGAPADSESLGGAWSLRFPKKGVSVVYARLDGAAIIYLKTREAGDIGGVRLGDTRESVLARWGAPSVADGANALYQAGPWLVVLTLDGAHARVAALGLGRVGGQD